MRPVLFSSVLQRFFTERLIRQTGASPHTVASYRDSFRLLLAFAQEDIGKEPSSLLLSDVDASLVGRFLAHVERGRGNCVRTRNVRAAAIRSLFRYAALEEPACALMIQRVLAIPTKRFSRREISYLSHAEAQALIDSPNLCSWSGRRDRALLLLMVQTGLRVSEVTGLVKGDIALGAGSHVHCHGKGRKERCTPLLKKTGLIMSSWLKETEQRSDAVLFPSARGQRLSSDGVAYILSKHVKSAARCCASLNQKHVTPHTLRHTAAMELLRGGVARAVIALWLGHESIESTGIYLHANLEMKEKALANATPYRASAKRFRPSDDLMEFLKNL